MILKKQITIFFFFNHNNSCSFTDETLPTPVFYTHLTFYSHMAEIVWLIYVRSWGFVLVWSGVHSWLAAGNLTGFLSVFIAAKSVELVLGDLYSLLLKCVLSSSQAVFRGWVAHDKTWGITEALGSCRLAVSGAYLHSTCGIFCLSWSELFLPLS